MQALIAGVVAAFVGVFFGFWLRGSSAKAEKAQSDRRAEEMAAELASVRAALAQVQAESAARAGFESLAGERSRSIAQMAAERDGLRAEIENTIQIYQKFKGG